MAITEQHATGRVHGNGCDVTEALSRSLPGGTEEYRESHTHVKTPARRLAILPVVFRGFVQYLDVEARRASTLFPVTQSSIFSPCTA
jgi:hypothetical protein